MLASLIFSAYRRRVLGLLLLHPDRSYYVRELARLTASSAGTLHKELSRLRQGGLLNRQEVGNQVRYSANRDCPIFEELASILRKTSGLADVLSEALIGIEGQIDFAFVFGSVARGEQNSNSDVDVMVVGNIGFSEVIQSLHPTQLILQREINPVVYSRAEFQRRVKAGEPFIVDVLRKSKLFVVGDENDIGKLTQD